MNTRDAAGGWSARLAAAALLLLWCVGLFGRDYWTPDEPREAALAASVAAQPAALPTLAGATFAEKPPLTYWLAGASMHAFGGARPAAARVPQLFYALLAFCAVFALARAALGGDAAGRALAFATALVFASSELVYQVQIWLDTDALLLAGVAVALAGMYAGLAAAAGTASGTKRRRLRGYAVMHAGLTLAFFGKNFAAWMVPVLAFLGFIAWERRWRELLRWEFWLPALLPLACIGLWVMAVAARADGAQALRVLFWNNLVGRALPVAAEAQFNYTTGHPNWPGRYLTELPVDLLPWTPLAIAALWAAWRGARHDGPRRAAWRFALCAALPGLLLLSLAATARSIYAAPCLIGFALLIGLWAAGEPVAAPATAGARRAFALTAWLLAFLALLILGLTVALQATIERATPPVFMLSAIVAATVMVRSLRQIRTDLAPAQRLGGLASGWALLLSLGVLSLYGAMNRSQDLAALAARLAQTAGPRPLLLWSPDETTLALAQLYLPANRWSALDGSAADAAAQLARRLQAAPGTTVASLIPGSGWSRADWRAYLQGTATPAALSKSDAAGDPALLAAGLVLDGQVERPGGRGYLLWRVAAR